MTAILNSRSIRWRELRVGLIVLGAVLLSLGLLVGNAKALSVLAALNPGTGNVAYGGTSSTSLTSSAVCPLNGGTCSGTLTSSIGTRMPFTMTLTNLYGTMATAAGSTASCTFVVRTSAGGTSSYVSTPLQCTVGGGQRSCTNTTSTVTVNAGDSVQMEYVTSGTCSGYITFGVAGAYSL